MTEPATLTKRKSIVRTTLLVLPAQIAFRAGEALLPLLLSYWFGRSRATDVYYFAWAIFALAGSLVFSAYQDSAIVPILVRERLERPKELPKLLGSLLAHTWAIGGAIAALVSGVAMGWFAYRYDGADLVLSAKMIAPFALYLVAISTRTFFASLLVVEHHYVVQSLASGLGMVVNIALLAAFHDSLGVVLIPFASLVGETIAASMLAWFTVRIVGLRLSFGFSRPPALVQFAKLVSSEVAGGAVTRINPVIDQLMAGLTMVAGGGTILRYSGDVSSVPTSILQATLLSVLLAHLSDDFARGDLQTFRRTVIRALATVSAILVAAGALLFAVRGPLLRFVFLRGEMDEGGVDRMIEVLPYHLVGLAPFGALLILSRAHVALQNSGIMLRMGIMNAGCNIVFNVLLLQFMGLSGIALATSGVQAAVALVFWILFEKRIRELRAQEAAQKTIRVGAA